MGGLFCKKSSGARTHRVDSRRNKPQRGDCLLRGPCMLCFIVHSTRQEPPVSEPASPELPAARTTARDCAHLLLLCPGELGTWQDRGSSLLCAGVLSGPGLLRAVTSPPAEDMVCKRKKCEENQESLTPCKQPRCDPDREQSLPLPAEQPQHCSQHSAALSSGHGSHLWAEDQAPHFSGSQAHPSSETHQLTGDSAHTSTEEHAQCLPGDPALPYLPETQQLTVESAKPCHNTLLQPPNDNSVEQEYPLTGKSEPLNSKACCCTSSCSDPSLLAVASSQDHIQSPTCSCNKEADLTPQKADDVTSPCEPLHINQLPPSLLLKILSHLSLNERCLSASLVCKYWRDLCLDFQFWKQLDLSSRQQVKDTLLERIASSCWNITEINISDCLNVTDAGVCTLARRCSGLVKYTAYRCKQLSDSSLISLATYCPSLQKVHVGNQDRLTDDSIRQLGSRCRDLRDIHFGQCYDISDEGMIVIAERCPKLQRIYMQENRLVTNKTVKALAENCPDLQYVGFMGCSVTSKGVIHLTNLKNLSSLDLRHIIELSNETVMEIVKKCLNLASLNLCLNRNIDDRCVEAIAKEGRNLRELYLVTCKITDNALIAIGRYSMTIETVDVGWCKEITDHGAILIAQSSKSIRYLGLMRCDQVNESTVEQLVHQYPHITFSTVLQDCKRTLERAYQMGWTPNTSSAS